MNAQLPPPPWKSYIPFLSSSSSSAYGGGGPSPAPGGIIGWFKDRIRLIRHRAGNTRTAAGAYEGSSSAGAYNAGYASTGGAGGNGNRGFDHLEDDPWDSRVGGYNPYEEERELGLVPPAAGGHGYRPDGEGYQMNLAVAPPGAGQAGEADDERRGRTRSRSPGPPSKGNPFGDEAEPSNLSLRGVSPRPMETGDASFAGRKAAREDHDRRSMFREDV
jgi:hypothetical protein